MDILELVTEMEDFARGVALMRAGAEVLAAGRPCECKAEKCGARDFRNYAETFLAFHKAMMDEAGAQLDRQQGATP